MIGHELDRWLPTSAGILEAASAAGVEFSAAAVAAAEQIGLDDVEPPAPTWPDEARS